MHPSEPAISHKTQQSCHLELQLQRNLLQLRSPARLRGVSSAFDSCVPLWFVLALKAITPLVWPWRREEKGRAGGMKEQGGGGGAS